MQPYTAELDMSDIEKGTYPHYMLKEMDEQPAVVRKIIQAYQNEQGELTIDEAILEALTRCGSSLYYCGRNELSCRTNRKTIF